MVLRDCDGVSVLVAEREFVSLLVGVSEGDSVREMLPLPVVVLERVQVLDTVEVDDLLLVADPEIVRELLIELEVLVL